MRRRDSPSSHTQQRREVEFLVDDPHPSTLRAFPEAAVV